MPDNGLPEDMTTRTSRDVEGSLVHDRVTVVLHWFTVALVLLLRLIGGFLEVVVPRGPLRGTFRSLHVAAGFILMFTLASFFFWRSRKGRRITDADPGPLHVLARATHPILYGLLPAIIALAVGNAVVRGVNLFGLVRIPQFGDRGYRFVSTRWHGIVADTVMIVALFHASAALMHHHVRRDGVLRRMLPGLRQPADEPEPFQRVRRDGAVPDATDMKG